MKKRVLALLLALVMLLGVMAGCSKKGETDAQNGTSETGKKPAANKVSQPEKALSPMLTVVLGIEMLCRK